MKTSVSTVSIHSAHASLGAIGFIWETVQSSPHIFSVLNSPGHMAVASAVQKGGKISWHAVGSSVVSQIGRSNSICPAIDSSEMATPIKSLEKRLQLSQSHSFSQACDFSNCREAREEPTRREKVSARIFPIFSKKTYVPM